MQLCTPHGCHRAQLNGNTTNSQYWLARLSVPAISPRISRRGRIAEAGVEEQGVVKPIFSLHIPRAEVLTS